MINYVIPNGTIVKFELGYKKYTGMVLKSKSPNPRYNTRQLIYTIRDLNNSKHTCMVSENQIYEPNVFNIKAGLEPIPDLKK